MSIQCWSLIWCTMMRSHSFQACSIALRTHSSYFRPCSTFRARLRLFEAFDFDLGWFYCFAAFLHIVSTSVHIPHILRHVSSLFQLTANAIWCISTFITSWFNWFDLFHFKSTLWLIYLLFLWRNTSYGIRQCIGTVSEASDPITSFLIVCKIFTYYLWTCATGPTLCI